MLDIYSFLRYDNIMSETPTTSNLDARTPEQQAAIDAVVEVTKKVNSHEKAVAKIKPVHALFEHMQEISDDPSGSDPADYLDEIDAEACKKLLEVAEQVGWAGSRELEMRISRGNRFGHKAWKSSLSVARTAFTKTLAFPAIWEGRGYVIGDTGVSPSQTVFLCQDGKLRSMRGMELTSSKAFGAGRLPDPDILEAALYPSHKKIDLPHEGLIGKVLSQIPADKIPDLKGFGR